MELAAAQACFDFFITVAGLSIPIFVSDRHRGVAKWIRESHPTVQHFFDQWHIAKGVVKKCWLRVRRRDVSRLPSGQKE